MRIMIKIEQTLYLYNKIVNSGFIGKPSLTLLQLDWPIGLLDLKVQTY